GRGGNRRAAGSQLRCGGRSAALAYGRAGRSLRHRSRAGGGGGQRTLRERGREVQAPKFDLGRRRAASGDHRQGEKGCPARHVSDVVACELLAQFPAFVRGAAGAGLLAVSLTGRESRRSSELTSPAS